MSYQATNEYLPEYKLVVLGASAVGKSSLVLHFIERQFIELEFDPTIEDSYSKHCVIDNEEAVLDIFDTGGHEVWPWSALREQYMQIGEGFLLVYSIIDRDSFVVIQSIHRQILRVKDKSEFPMILVANKADLETERVVSYQEGEELAKTLKIGYVEASAKDIKVVDKVFHNLVQIIRKGQKSSSSKKNKKKECTIF